jgi:hypothetical protein
MEQASKGILVIDMCSKSDLLERLQDANKTYKLFKNN